MARIFNGTSDCLAASVDLSAYSTIALVFWMYWDAFANDDDFAFEYSTNHNLVTDGFAVDPNHSGGSDFRISIKGDVGYSTGDFTRPSAAAWHQYVINLDKTKSSSEVDSVYVDGVAQTLSRQLDSNNTNGFGNYSLNFMCRNGASLFAAGRMAEVAIYGGALISLASAEALADGFSPMMIQPSSLAAYWQLIGRTSPEIELMNGASATVTGAAVTEHPRIIYPAPPQISYFIPGISSIGLFDPDLRPEAWFDTSVV